MRYMKGGGGGFGRTLARAWSSQSGRRRVAGIRLPREKRKALVESFVKQYQQSNNGKFPSVMLIRQEVGGSSLVLRHILQEVKFVWSRDQAQKPDLSERSPQGIIPTESQSSSVTSSPNRTVSVAGEQHSILDGAYHPVSDALGAESEKVDIENLRKVDGDSVTVEKLNSDGPEVAAVQASGSEVKQPAGLVLEAYHLHGDVDSDRSNAGEVRMSGSLEDNEQAKAVPDVVVNTTALERNESAKQSLVKGQASGGSMRVAKTVEASKVKVTAKGNLAVEASHSQPVPTGEREELDTRDQGFSSDKDRSLEQSYSRSEKVEIVADDSAVSAGGVHQADPRADVADNVEHSRDRSNDERALQVPVERETKTIGAALKSFVVTAFRKFWPG